VDGEDAGVSTTRDAAGVRARLGHPVIDADGHVLELFPAVFPFLRDALGPAKFEEFRRQGPIVRRDFPRPSDADLLAARIPQGAWWGETSVERDRATYMLPRLLHERMDELGLDFAVLYPTNCLSELSIEDDELRIGTCRGFNEYYAATYGPYADRLAAAGVIPMHTPAEAVAELEHCHALGIKVVAFPEGVLRPIEQPSPVPIPQLWPGQRHWWDTFGFESAHDYDPVWARAAELGYAVTFHGSLAIRPGTVHYATNYVANHLGWFASLMRPVCTSLLFGGVTRRFPDVAFAFLECGVSWAHQLLLDVVGHWDKRRVEALRAHLDPADVDHDELERLVTRYGDAVVTGATTEAERRWAYTHEAIDMEGPPGLDDFAAIGARDVDELCDRFTRSFWFGCEADDRGVATAFAPTNPGGRVLQAVFSSDIGHWDVPDPAGVLPDAYELVEDGVLTAEQFRAFTFEHAARLLTRANPEFFRGTAIDAERLAAP
jgi:predicted TIM-barrel fold metal-dependent hydrolase